MSNVGTTPSTRNQELIEWMAERELTAGGLASLVNAEIGALTGTWGKLTEGTVRKWRAGRIRWPRTIQRVALARVSGLDAAALGFADPSASDPGGDPVNRRAFVTSATTAAAAAAVPMLATRPAVGTADVHRLQEAVVALTALDEQRGGHEAIENAALAGARHALDLQQGTTTGERIRRRLFSVAADYTALAAWSCIDTRDKDRDQGHLNRAMTLAGLAQDSIQQFRIWQFMSMLAQQRGQPTDALAAAQASRNTGAARRDPLVASLAHARTALAHSQLGDWRAALRSIDYAQDTLTKARNVPRPAWINFYDRAELDGLSGVALMRISKGEQAEYHLHHCLSSLRGDQHRNRALYTAYVAVVQLNQGDAEQACATATAAASMPTAGVGRTAHVLSSFTAALDARAPGSRAARQWAEYIHTA